MLMHTIIVILHVTAMIASMVLMIGAVGVGFAGKKAAVRIAGAGFVSAIVGFISGGILLFGATLSIECALLTAYLVGITLFYHLGFAFGDVENAKLVRNS
jgi:hypothetical protein